jgi:hypothetical protein
MGPSRIHRRSWYTLELTRTPLKCTVNPTSVNGTPFKYIEGPDILGKLTRIPLKCTQAPTSSNGTSQIHTWSLYTLDRTTTPLKCTQGSSIHGIQRKLAEMYKRL